jgi:hypothetical protein
MLKVLIVKQRLPSFDWVRRYASEHRLKVDRYLFKQIGYHSVVVDVNNWREVHQWCKDNIDKDEYTWTGEVFWFRDDRQALLFSLAWAT